MIISRVAKGSAAERAGLEVGDVIVAVDGKRVRSTTDVQNVIYTIDIMEKQNLTLTIFREGKRGEVELKLERPSSEER